MKNSPTSKVQQRFKAKRLSFSASDPNNITVVKVGKSVWLEIKKQKRPRQKPRDAETNSDYGRPSYTPCQYDRPKWGCRWLQLQEIWKTKHIQQFYRLLLSVRLPSTTFLLEWISIDFVLAALILKPSLWSHRFASPWAFETTKERGHATAWSKANTFIVIK